MSFILVNALVITIVFVGIYWIGEALLPLDVPAKDRTDRPRSP